MQRRAGCENCAHRSLCILQSNKRDYAKFFGNKA